MCDRKEIEMETHVEEKKDVQKRGKVGRTLDPNFVLPRGHRRQISAVYIKNSKLALRSWVTYAIFYAFEILMVCIVGVILISLGEEPMSEDDVSFNTPDGKYTPTPRSNKQLGPALTWVSPSIRTESISDETGWGICSKDSMACSGMIGAINQPVKFKSSSSKEELSIRYPFDETKPITQWDLYPSFQQDDLYEFTSLESAKKGATDLITDQLVAIRESYINDEEDGFNMFEYIYPWVVLATEYSNPSEQMYVRNDGNETVCDSYLQEMFDYKIKASHQVMIPRKSQNIVNIVTDAYAMEAIGTLQTALMRYTLTEHFSNRGFLNKKYSYVMVNATWRALPYFQYTSNDTNTAESFGMYIYPLVLLIIIIPNMLYTGASEKQNGLKRMETLMGLDQYRRLIGNFLFYAVICAIGMGFLIAVGLIFQLPFFYNTDGIFIFMLSLCSIIVIPLHGLFLNSFFSSGKSAALLGLLLVVVEFAFFFGLSGGSVYQNCWWSIYPIFGLLASFRSISEGVVQNSLSTWLTLDNMYHTDDNVYKSCVAVFVDCCLSIVLSIVLYMPLGVYIENIMPNSSIRKHWLYPLEWITRKAHAVDCARIAGQRGCSYDVECGSYDTNVTLRRIFAGIKILFKNRNMKIIRNENNDIVKMVNTKQKKKTSIEGHENLLNASTCPEVLTKNSELDDSSDIPITDLNIIKTPQNKTGAYLRSLSDVVAYQRYIEDDPDLKKMQKRAMTGEGNEPHRRDIVRVIGLIKAYGKLPRKLPVVSSTSLDDTVHESATPSNLKVSVKGVSFTVRYDECFGLLGPNGAGKSTTLTILSGANRQSAGRVLVDGIDTSYANKLGREHITSITGVCEQFDTLYGKLTVEEHVRHAAKIKGIDPRYMEEHISDIINGVGLTAQRKMRSAAMSGGMQRRLSVGLAMVCSPKIIYFDEPTTGLDPETRRSLWLTLMGLKRKRSLVLCTHSLDECEYLCSSPESNIAIMANGGLRGIGTAEYLKRRFGEGAKIQVMVSGNKNAANDGNNNNNNNNNGGHDGVAESEDENLNVLPSINASTNGIYLTPNEQLVHNIISTRVNVSLVSAYCGTLTYNILGNTQEGQQGTKRPKIAGIFRIMEQIAKECPTVTDWGVSLTSLESVFLNIVSASAECQV